MLYLASHARAPSILVPYPGPCGDPGVQDVFLCLRPETNGALVESLMFKAIRKDPRLEGRVALAYLANLPGDFIADRRVIEDHYSLKRRFAELGGSAFTPGMRRAFSERFGLGYRDARILGAYDAMRELELDPEGLFRLWVPERDFCVIHGQTIKRFGGLFVVNYGIPALLRRNGPSTDLAAMIIRGSLDYGRGGTGGFKHTGTP